MNVAVAMSGGVDSSVAAAILLESGYRVTGFTFQLWDRWSDNPDAITNSPVNAITDAQSVCSILGIEHRILDFRMKFRKEVLDRFESGYLAGETPNPCVQCNSVIKWGAFAEEISAMGIRSIATGHYACILKDADGEPRLVKGMDGDKDQSYFLWKIPRELLHRTVLPLGMMTKSDVREKARQLGLPVADRAESQEVCFLQGENYRTWLEQKHPQLSAGTYAGEFLDMEDKHVGYHDGYPLFTIGQRKGLGLGGGKKYFVISINPENHVVRLGNSEDLNRREFRIGNYNRLTEVPLNGDRVFNVKVRYLDTGVPARVYLDETGQHLTIRCEKPVQAVTPGQSAVLYSGDEVVAGGIILAE